MQKKRKFTGAKYTNPCKNAVHLKKSLYLAKNLIRVDSGGQQKKMLSTSKKAYI